MPKKLAIAIAGAVSLGCYEAGVLYEIIRAIRMHNTHPETTPEQRIEIDVLTGASAGAMTATIAAQKLLFEAQSLDQPYANSFYRPWVKDVDMMSLLNLQPGEDESHSILSSNVVETISRNHITLRYCGGMAPVRRKHEAAGSTIALGLALSNLNGVDWQRQTYAKDDFVYTCYQDEVKRRLDSNDPNDDTMAVWEFLRNAAVSSGAFPFAFRTKELVRHQAEYEDAGASPKPFSSDPQRFTYSDGGLFQNEPLGLAKDLVDLQDPSHEHTDERFYLFVSPESKGSTSGSKFSEQNANLAATARQLIGVIFNQARFHDWIQAEDVNKAIALFNERAMQLHQALINQILSYQCLKNGASSLVNSLIPNRDRRDAALRRVKTQWKAEYDALASSPAGSEAADTWIDAILVLETAANLGDRDEMRIYGVTASDNELAGAQGFAFLGFLDQRYRDHDYDVGRRKAREFISSVNSLDAKGNPDPLAPIRYSDPPDDIHNIDESLNGLCMDQVSPDLRGKLKDRLKDRANLMLGEMGIPLIERGLIDLTLITPNLNKLLGL